MRKEWFSSRELAAIDGLPSTTQGINRRARMEKWQSRKRSGVQGKAIEYHVDSLPACVHTYLTMKEDPNFYDINTIEPIKIWLAAYFQLTEKEKDIILEWLLRHGLRDLLAFIALTEKNKTN